MTDGPTTRPADSAVMNALATATATATGVATLRLGVHLLVAGSIGIVSLFTALAWPFAIAVGAMVGAADAKRQRGEHEARSEQLGRELLIVLGVLGMLFFGAIVGGLIAFAVVALAAFSERAAAQYSRTDRGVARILVFVVPIAMWLFVFPLLGVNVDIRIGG